MSRALPATPFVAEKCDSSARDITRPNGRLTPGCAHKQRRGFTAIGPTDLEIFVIGELRDEPGRHARRRSQHTADRRRDSATLKPAEQLALRFLLLDVRSVK
jgi:hypothetical protein